jgi:hypothetical protein
MEQCTHSILTNQDASLRFFVYASVRTRRPFCKGLCTCLTCISREIGFDIPPMGEPRAGSTGYGGGSESWFDTAEPPQRRRLLNGRVSLSLPDS